jgi:hypothetical protein
LAEIAALFANPLLAAQYFEMIRQVKGRYLRDRCSLSGKHQRPQYRAGKRSTGKCVQERYLSAVIFSELITMQEEQDKSITAPTGKIILLDPYNTRKAETKPDKSNLGDYEEVFK